MTPTPGRVVDVTQRDHQFSQELQLLSPSTGSFHWVVGGFYFDARGRYDPVLLTNSGPAIAPAGPAANVVRIRTVSAQDTRSGAAFAQLTWHVTDALRVTGGLRYTDEKRSLNGTQSQFRADGTSFVSVPPTDESLGLKRFTWRLATSYDFSPTAIGYLSYNRGFKSGGFDPSALTIPPYRPETLDAYEAGLKLTLLDHRVRLNSSIYHYDYKNVQVQRLVFGGAATYNGAAATLYGGEIELNARVTDQLVVNAGYEYIHSRYNSFPNALVSRLNPAGGTILDSAGNATGNRLPVSPKSTINAAATYSVPIAGGNLEINGNVYHNSGYFGEPDNRLRQPGYTLLGASLRYIFPGNRWTAGIWGTNLTNKVVSDLLNSQPEGNPVPGSTTRCRRSPASASPRPDCWARPSNSNFKEQI